MLQETKYKILLMTVLGLLFVACGTPVPDDKMEYVGEWQSKEMYLLILADGSLKYERIEDGVTTSINGFLTEFNGDNFEGGVPFLTSTFVVSKPPYQNEGVWKMTVDGVELTKVQ